MKSLGLLAARLILGGYLVAHGAQKLFGAFGGYGLEATGGHFESIGLKPGKAMAGVAGATELGGGALTAAGIASPLGPIMVIGTMGVAAFTHRAKGPLASAGGYEPALTNLAAAAALAAAGPGAFRLGPNLSPRLARRAALVGIVMAGVSIYQLLNVLEAEAPAAEEEAGADEASAATAETGAD
jgi:putative oxidoreductase